METVGEKRRFARRAVIAENDIRDALVKSGGRVVQTARLLGIPRNTLATRLAEIARRYLMNGFSERKQAGYEYDLSILTPDTWNVPRGCFYCGVDFTPKRRNDWGSHFCCAEHRKAHHYTPIKNKIQAATSVVK